MIDILIREFAPKQTVADQNALEQFQKQWSTYQKLVTQTRSRIEQLGSKTVIPDTLTNVRFDPHQRTYRPRLLRSHYVCFVPIPTSASESASAIGGRSAHGGDVPCVDPTLLRSRGVGHLHPTIFAPYHSEFGVLCHHADSWR